MGSIHAMKEGRKFYIIPGLGESTRAQNYREIIKGIRASGFDVVPINLEWDLDVPFSEFVKKADKQIPNNIAEDYILGFSFGAYIVALLAPKKKACGYFFCSISPYFKNDLRYIPQETKDYFGTTFMSSFKKYSFPENMIGNAWVFIGDKDWKIAQERARDSYNKWKGNKEMFIVKGAGHELKNPNYTKEVLNVIKKL
jgi:hypothetical protein